MIGRSLCTVLLVLLWGQPALAQEASGAMAPEDGHDNGHNNRHRIEIIVFRHLDQRGTTPEEATAGVSAQPLADSAMVAAASAAPVSADSAGPWPTLNSTELRLGAIATRLRQSSAYQLLYHGGWLQTLAPRDQTASTPLPAPAHAAGLDGTITVYRENFVHVLLDIGLREPTAEEAGSDVVYVLRQSRRLRGQAAQYFDHPRFGVILLVE